MSGEYRNKMMVSRPVCFTLKEAAQALRVSPRTVLGMTHDGRLPSLRIGARRLVPAKALWEFVDANTINGK